MSKAINKVMIMGYVGADATEEKSVKGIPYTKFSIATNETWTDTKKQKHSKTTWHNVIGFGYNIVEISKKFVKKGARVYVEGMLRNNSYIKKDGSKGYSHFIQADQINIVQFKNTAQSPQGNTGYSPYEDVFEAFQEQQEW